MKKSRITELLANIRATIVSFFSIVMFVALAVGLYLGIRGSAVALGDAAQDSFEKNAFHDFQVVFPYGLSDDDFKAMGEIEGVEQVTKAHAAYVHHEADGAGHAIQLTTLTDDIDICSVNEGELPTKAGEIALGSRYCLDHNINVGDTISFVHTATNADDKDGMRYLNSADYKVTGIVSNPNYISLVGGMMGVSDTGSALEGFGFVTDDNFDENDFEGYWPCALIRCSSLRGLHFLSDEYQTKTAELKKKIIEVGEPRARARYEAIKAEAQKKIDEAQKQIDEGETLLADANTQITEGENAIRDGQTQIDMATQQLESGEATYAQTKATGESALASLRATLAKVQASYDEAQGELNTAKTRADGLTGQFGTYDQGLTKLTEDLTKHLNNLKDLNAKHAKGEISDEEYEAKKAPEIIAANKAITTYVTTIPGKIPAFVKKYPAIMIFATLTTGSDGEIEFAESTLDTLNSYLSGARSMVDEANGTLNTAQARVDSLGQQLNDGWAQYYAAEASLNQTLAENYSKIEQGRTDIEEGKATLEEKKGELEEGKKTVAEKTTELEAGKSELEKAKDQVDAIKYMSWIVSTRFTASGSIALMNIINLTKNLRLAMASLFVIVGLFVCYSALSRIVHEQIRQIGTKKALGFRGKEITSQYLSYTALAVVIGVLLGILVSMFVVQGILYPRLIKTFDLVPAGPSFELKDTAIIAAIELALLLASTWLACHSVLKRQAVDLLIGEQVGNGTTRFYERWAIWKKLPLFTQTVINNCVSDKRRVFATIVGVAGCTALVVTATTLDGNITRSLEDHFGMVYDFDVTVKYDASVEGAKEGIAEVLEEKGCLGTPVRSTMYLLENDTDPAYEFVYVPEDSEGFAQLFHLNAVAMGGHAPTEGAWLSQSHADHRGLKVGDKLSICTVTGERCDLNISGFFNFYLPNNAIVMSPEYYEHATGSSANPNCFIVSLNETSKDELTQALSKVDGFTAITDERESVEGMINLFKSITTTVVGVYVALSALMAIIVLLNLDYMFIDEKKRELIVLMINGYSVKDAKAYIYRDAIVMTILGIIVGVIVGNLTGIATVGAVEWQSCSFLKTIYTPACLIGAGMSAVFSAVVMLVALRRIPRFALTDIARF